MNRRTKRELASKALSSQLQPVQLLLRPELLEHDDHHDGWTAIRPRTFADLRSHAHQIVLTAQDETNLRRLVQEHKPYIDPAILAQLEAELDRALLIDETHIPTDVVTMNSRVLYEEYRPEPAVTVNEVASCWATRSPMPSAVPFRRWTGDTPQEFRRQTVGSAARSQTHRVLTAAIRGRRPSSDQSSRSRSTRPCRSSKSKRRRSLEAEAD